MSYYQETLTADELNIGFHPSTCEAYGFLSDAIQDIISFRLADDYFWSLDDKALYPAALEWIIEIPE